MHTAVQQQIPARVPESTDGSIDYALLPAVHTHTSTEDHTQEYSYARRLALAFPNMHLRIYNVHMLSTSQSKYRTEYGYHLGFGAVGSRLAPPSPPRLTSFNVVSGVLSAGSSRTHAALNVMRQHRPLCMSCVRTARYIQSIPRDYCCLYRSTVSCIRQLNKRQRCIT